MALEALDPKMEARLLDRYMAHAKHVLGLVYVNPKGHQPRGAAFNVLAACMDLGAHEGQERPGEGFGKSMGWRCNDDCLTCYEEDRRYFLESKSPSPPADKKVGGEDA